MGPTATAMDFTTARGRPRLSPRLRLSPTTTVDTTAMDSATVLATGPTAMDFTMARGRLRLSPRLIPTCCTVATGPTAMATPPEATADPYYYGGYYGHGLGYGYGYGLGYRTYWG